MLQGGRLGSPPKMENDSAFQGSRRLSCVLANVVVASADEACGRVMAHHRRSFYARYCDDVVIASDRSADYSASNGVVPNSASGTSGAATIPSMEGSAPRQTTLLADQVKDVYRWTHPRLHGLHWLGFLDINSRRDGRVRES